MNKVTETAPKRIWIQISDEAEHCNEPFPEPTEDTTWCCDSVLACEVEYVRAGGFSEWWHTVGSGIKPKPGEDEYSHAERVARAAWTREVINDDNCRRGGNHD